MTTLQEFKDLRRDIAETAKRLDEMKNRLKRSERDCSHIWGDTKYTPEHHKGYRIEGDPPGTMGVDRRLPMNVPAETAPKWTRICTVCDKTEVTTQTSDKVEKVPRFFR